MTTEQKAAYLVVQSLGEPTPIAIFEGPIAELKAQDWCDKLNALPNFQAHGGHGQPWTDFYIEALPLNPEPITTDEQAKAFGGNLIT